MFRKTENEQLELFKDIDLANQIQDQQGLVNNMQGSNTYDVNMKWILTKMLEFKSPNFIDFDISIWDDIYNLALQCSADAGHAVYVARSLYHTKEWVDFNDLQICNNFQERKVNPNEEVIKTVEIFPNPSQGEFTLTWTEDDSAILNILDAQGRNVYSQTVQTGQNSIQTKNMSAGIYFYTIKNTTGINSQGKLIILDK